MEIEIFNVNSPRSHLLEGLHNLSEFDLLILACLL